MRFAKPLVVHDMCHGLFSSVICALQACFDDDDDMLTHSMQLCIVYNVVIVHNRSVQMRLYTLNKRHFALVFLSFLICFSITIIIGLSGKYFTLFFICDCTKVCGSVV